MSASRDERASLQVMLVDMTLQVAECKEQLSVLTKEMEERAQVSEQNDGEGAGDEREVEPVTTSDMISGIDVTGGAVKWLRLL
jgi:hypothetical protein